MKRTVYIMRHAKTEQIGSLEQTDYQRNLLPRGKNDAQIIAESFARQNQLPDILISSTANRAMQTCEIVSETLKFTEEQILWKKNLYMADPHQIERVLSELPDECSTVLLIAHNMGVTDYVNMKIQDFHIDHLPTAGIIGFELDLENWISNYLGIKGKFLYADFPRNHRNQ